MKQLISLQFSLSPAAFFFFFLLIKMLNYQTILGGQGTHVDQQNAARLVCEQQIRVRRDFAEPHSRREPRLCKTDQ